MPEVTLREAEGARREELYHDIGEFFHTFSHLEFTIRIRLSRALNLTAEQIDAVTGPYDYVALCNVATRVLSLQYPALAKEIDRVLSKCKGLAEWRNRIAHGFWMVDNAGYSASHIPRNKLIAETYFEDAKKLQSLTEKASIYMFEVINIGDSRESPDPLSGIEPIEGEDAEQQTTYEWKRIDRSE